MKGFTITHNESSINVGVEEGGLCSVLFHLFAYGESSASIHVTSTNYDKKERSVWLNRFPIGENDVWKIEYREIEAVSPPVESTFDVDIRRPSSKLESFRHMEEYLKEKGLI